MDIHLITSDETSFDLINNVRCKINITCVIVPENRIKTEKVARVIEHAKERSIPVRIHQLRSYFVDPLPSASAAISWLYSQIIRSKDLARYTTGILNMHGGKIPDYRGASVLHWSIINGEVELGVTWHKMVKEVDAGPIISENTIPIRSDATAWEMRQYLIDKAIEMFPEAWQRFINNYEGRTPDLKQGQIWHQRKPSDSLIKDGWTEKMVKDLIRAMCPPWPRAYVEIEEKRFEIEKVLNVPQPDTLSYLTADGNTIYLKKVMPDLL